MYKNKKIKAVFFTSIAVLSSVGIYYYLVTNSYRNSSMWVTQSATVILDAKNMEIDIRNSESAMRGYLITGDIKLLKSFLEDHKKLENTYLKLKDLTKNKPSQQILLDSLYHAVTLNYDFLKYIYSVMKKKGTVFAMQLDKSGRGVNLMKDVVIKSDTFIKNEKKILKDRLYNESQKFLTINTVFVVCIILSIVIVLIALFLFIKDNDERLLQEEKLTEYKHFFFNTENFSCIANVHGYFEVINSNFEKLLGYTENELLESQFVSFVHPDDVDSTLKEIEKLRNSSKTIHFENRCRKKDGNYLHLIWNATFIPVSGKLYAIARDITGQKKVEKEVSDYKYALDESTIVAITDSKGIINYVNNNFCKISKYSREELIGKDHRILSSGHHPKEFIQDLWVTITNGKVWKNDLKNKAKDGTYYWVDTTIVPILGQDGKSFEYMAIRSDITERKIIEEKVQRAFERIDILARATSDTIWDWDIVKNKTQYNEGITKMFGYELEEVDDTADWWKNNIHPDDNQSFSELIDDAFDKKNKTIQMEYQYRCADGSYKHILDRASLIYDKTGNPIRMIGAMQDVTEKKNLAIEVSKAKESFLANMSHEIRTPLNAIIGFLRELEKQELTGLQKTYVKNSSIASKHLLAILGNILDLSKIEAGEMSLEEEDFLIEDTLNSVLTVLNLKAEQKKIMLTSLISDNVSKVFKGDSLRLEQILFNLIGNALKFTQKGKIVVKCEVLFDSHVSQIIQISVADTGIGMEQKYADSIFSKFSQEDKSITRKYGGTGLGMVITKELVHLMGGEIEIESKKNIGTTVHIKINLIKGNIERVKILQEKVDFILKGLTILLVEDNEMNRMVVQNVLQYYNCTVIEAENGIEALAILKTRNFDLILMDIQMPEMDGIEATKVIRNELNLSTPIIALTANAFKTEIEICKQAGMNDYVVKPFEESVLLQIIVKHTINKNGIPFLEDETNPNQLLYNINALHDLSRGNDEFVVKMVGVFVEQTITTIEKIDAALESNNFLEISQLIHKIRPSTDNMGILSIQSEMKTLEKTAKETQNKVQITAIYMVVKKTLQHVISQLQKNELNA